MSIKIKNCRNCSGVKVPNGVVVLNNKWKCDICGRDYNVSSGEYPLPSVSVESREDIIRKIKELLNELK